MLSSNATLFAPEQESKSSAEELKSHAAFINQESKGYEVQVLNRTTQKEEPAIIRLISPKDDMYINRRVETYNHKTIMGNEFVPKNRIKEEHLTYELIHEGKIRGRMTVLLAYKTDTFTKKPAEDLYIETLQGSNGGNIGNVGLNLIKIAIILSHQKGFKGAISLNADGNSPGFYWLAGLSYDGAHHCYYAPQLTKAKVVQITKKLHSVKDDLELATDADCLEAKIVLAKKILAKELFETDTSFDQRVKAYAEKTISIQELRTEWPKVLKSRYLYEIVLIYDRILDELALSRLDIPRIKLHDKKNFERPDTRLFTTEWKLPAISIDEWKKLVEERHAELKQHIEKIKKGEIMDEKQFLVEEIPKLSLSR